MLFILSKIVFDPIQIDNRPKYSFPFFQLCSHSESECLHIFFSLLNIILLVGRWSLGRWVGWSVVGGSVGNWSMDLIKPCNSPSSTLYYHQLFSKHHFKKKVSDKSNLHYTKQCFILFFSKFHKSLRFHPFTLQTLTDLNCYVLKVKIDEYSSSFIYLFFFIHFQSESVIIFSV